MNSTDLAANAGAPRGVLSPQVLVPVALLGVYLLWGSTYYAIRVAVAGYPPFLMASMRFVVAGVLMLGLLRWQGVAWPTRRQWINCFITGTLLLGVGNGLVCFAEQTVASGIAAVAVASVALFMALFAGLYGAWPNRLEWVGLVVGFAGVVVLNFGGELSGSRLGAAALVVATIAWAFGSVWSKHQDMPNPMMSAAAQMLCSSMPLGIVALLTGEHFPATIPITATFAFVYLIIAGSLLGFSAYLYVLHHTRPALAASYAYVNPPVAVLVGVFIGGEAVTRLDVIGMIVILVGVVAITFAKAKR